MDTEQEISALETRLGNVETRLSNLEKNQSEMQSQVRAIYYAVAVLIPTALANLVGTIV